MRSASARSSALFVLGVSMPALIATMMFSISGSTSWRRFLACRRSGFSVRRCSVKKPTQLPSEYRLALFGEQVALDCLQQQLFDKLAWGHCRIGADGKAPVFPAAAAIAGRVENHEFVPAFSAPEEAREQIFWSTSRPRVGM